MIFFFFESRPAWSTPQIPDQVGLQRKILSQRKNWTLSWRPIVLCVINVSFCSPQTCAVGPDATELAAVSPWLWPRRLWVSRHWCGRVESGVQLRATCGTSLPLFSWRALWSVFLRCTAHSCFPPGHTVALLMDSLEDQRHLCVHYLVTATRVHVACLEGPACCLLQAPDGKRSFLERAQGSRGSQA